MKFVVLAVTAVSVVAAPVQARDRLVLEPATDWVMNYDEDSCALRRDFGAEGERVSLEMRKFGIEDEIQVIVASKDFVRRENSFRYQFVPIDVDPIKDDGLLKIGFANGSEGRLFTHSIQGEGEEYDEIYRRFVLATDVLNEEQRELVLGAIGLDEDSRSYRRLVVEDEFLAASRRAKRAFRQTPAYQDFISARERAVTGISLDSAFRDSLYLHTGQLHSAMDAMRECIDELQTHWGIDVEAHKTLQRAVEPIDYNRLVQEMIKDYPSEGLRRGLPAILRVRLDVSAEGEPTGCHMQSGMNHPSFAETACANMMRYARFRPALDAGGQPIPSYYQVTVQYTLS